jgi:hypothetical protein
MIGMRLQSKGLNELREKAAAIGAQSEMAVAGANAAANVTSDHLFALDSRGNAFGGKRTNFYSKAAKSVSLAQPTSGGASFTITKLGLAQRWLGGTIRAGAGTSSSTGRLTKYLAIPARSEAYGQPPSAFPDLQFVPRRNGGAMLVQALQTKVSISGRKKKLVSRGSEAGGLVMYWLVKSVTQEPDPSVMPTEEELLNAATAEMNNYLVRRLAS